MEFKHLILIITVFVIPVPKMNKPDKLPFFIIEWQFPSGYAKYSGYHKKIFKPIECCFFFPF